MMSGKRAFAKIILSALIAFLLPGCVTEEPTRTWSLGKGDSLPAFSITDLNGNVIDSSSFSKKRGVIIFFSVTCSDCLRELPRLEEAYREYLSSEGGKNLEVICISRDSDISEVRNFILEHDITMPVAVDKGREVYELFASSGVPRVYIVENGIIIDSYLEEIPITVF